MCRCSKNQTFDIRRNPCTYANWIRNHTGVSSYTLCIFYNTYTSDKPGFHRFHSWPTRPGWHGFGGGCLGESCGEARWWGLYQAACGRGASAYSTWYLREGWGSCIYMYIYIHSLGKARKNFTGDLIVIGVLMFDKHTPWKKVYVKHHHSSKSLPMNAARMNAWSDRFSIWMDLPQVPSCHRSILFATFDNCWPVMIRFSRPFVIREVLLEGSTAVGIRCQGNPSRLREIQNKPFFTMAL